MKFNLETLQEKIKEKVQAENEYKIANNRLGDYMKDFNTSPFLNLSYLEIKSIYEVIKYQFPNKESEDLMKRLVMTKKIEAHPEAAGVHYFSLLNQLDVSQEEKVRLDRHLYKGHRNSMIKGLDKEICDQLYAIGLVEKSYQILCTCEGWDCGRKHLNQAQLDKYFEYWNAKKNDLDYSDELEESVNDGYISFYCESEEENAYEFTINSLQDFEEANVSVYYSLLHKPDLTVENL